MNIKKKRSKWYKTRNIISIKMSETKEWKQFTNIFTEWIVTQLRRTTLILVILVELSKTFRWLAKTRRAKIKHNTRWLHSENETAPSSSDDWIISRMTAIGLKSFSTMKPRNFSTLHCIVNAFITKRIVIQRLNCSSKIYTKLIILLFCLSSNFIFLK